MISAAIWLFLGITTARAADTRLSFQWSDGASAKELHVWTGPELDHLKRSTCREKNPASGKICQYRGVLLSSLIEKSLEHLPLEQRAQVDLIVLKGAAGAQALMPRSLVTKYPLMVATQESGLQVVVPWTSKPRILSEDLPLESYFVDGLSQVELTSYRARYSALLLQRRTDPGAVRGEKLFVQACIGCHAVGQGPSVTEVSGEGRARKLASTGHPPVRGLPKLNDRDKRAIVSYLDAYRAERAQAAPASAVTSAAAGTSAPVAR